MSFAFVSRGKSTVTIPSGAKFFRASIYLDGNRPKYKVYQCKNGNQAIWDSINDPNVDYGNHFDDYDGKFDDFGIDDLAKTPIQLLQNIYNADSNTCSPLVLPITIGLHSQNASIPCGDGFWSSFPTSAVTLYHVLVFGLAAWFIMKKLIKLVEESIDPDDKSDMVKYF